MLTLNNLLESIKKFNMEKTKDKIVRFIRQKVEEAGAKGAVIGLSGGVDSALTLRLTVEALGSDKVTVLLMPHTKITPKQDVEDSWEITRSLNIKNVHEVPIDEFEEIFTNRLENIGFDLDKYSRGNLLARIRMTLLYATANRSNSLVIGTGDKSEIYIGYYTKYGDGGADILPIGDLYKTRVRLLAKHLGLPDKIAFKPSSPRLWEDHLAEAELGVTYEEVDAILFAFLDLKLRIEEIYKIEGLREEAIKKVLERIYKTEHKRMMPPIPKLFGGLTVGLDWRAPHHYELNL